MAFLDPGNLAGDIDAGQTGGYQLLWLLLVSTAIAYWFQVLAARIGTVLDKDLATLGSICFNKGVSIFLWLMAEIAIIGADICYLFTLYIGK